MFHCIEISVFDADLRRIVGFSWRGLVQQLSLRWNDDEGNVLGCMRDAVDDVLYGFAREGKKGAIVGNFTSSIP